MNEFFSLLFALSIGGVCGTIFFGGLWWTINRGLHSPRPFLWFLGSVLVRMSLVLCTFYFVGAGRWPRLALLLLGFLVARFVVTRQTKAWSGNQNRIRLEDCHAS